MRRRIVTEIGDGAWYVISVAAQRAEVHEQTLRHYERLGLIAPARKGSSPHSPRLYSDRDIERVVHIRRLMRDLGVNLAGVEAILYMKDRMEQIQEEQFPFLKREAHWQDHLDTGIEITAILTTQVRHTLARQAEHTTILCLCRNAQNEPAPI